MSNMLPRPLPESPPALADVLAVPVAPRGRHVEDGALAAQGGDRHLVGVGVDADVIGVALADHPGAAGAGRSEEHTSELQSLMRISYAVFCLQKKREPDRHIIH